MPLPLPSYPATAAMASSPALHFLPYSFGSLLANLPKLGGTRTRSARCAIGSRQSRESAAKQRVQQSSASEPAVFLQWKARQRCSNAPALESSTLQKRGRTANRPEGPLL